jgi:GT2 family glycosyltransferase
MEYSELEEREYDLSSRHVLVARIVRAIAPPGPVLDVGGSNGLTQLVLPERSVVAIDIRSSAVDIIASGAQLPFADRTFAAAMALDVLEHVPDGIKESLVDEAARVADVVIFAGPFDDPEVRSAERHQRKLFQEMFAQDHPWLAEHAASGLPSLPSTRQRLESSGFETFAFGSNPLNLWSVQLANTHIALRVGLDEKTLPLREWLLTEFLDRADATPPSYRHILTGSRNRGLATAMAGIVPQSDPELVLDAIARTDIATGAVIAHAWDVTSAIRNDAVRQWEQTAQTVRTLESALRSAPQERTLASLEWMVNNGQSWRDLLAGPEVQGNGETSTVPDPDTYGAWLRDRVVPETPDSGPKFSVIVPVFNPDARFLTSCIRSVRAQTYPCWELILVNASDAPHVRPICERFAEVDDRIIVVQHPNEGIAANTNAGFAVSGGDWIVFVDHDDVIEPHALGALARRLEEVPDAEFLFSDEDKIDSLGRYIQPFFKPGWSPDLLNVVNYMAHLVAVSRSLFERVGGIRTEFEGAQDYDFVLRATHEAARVEHISDVLYHWRQHAGSTASDVRFKPQAHGAGRRALQESVDLHHPGAWVDAGAGATAHRIRYPLRYELVSIIIPFRDQPKYTETCLMALSQTRLDLPTEILLVSNRSREPETFEAMERWQETWPSIRITEFDEPYNFHRLNNWAARQASGGQLLFLNNDTEPLHKGWLEALAEHSQRPSVGAVGGRLFYPNGLVQHAGVAIGIGGFADHPWAGLHPDADTPAGPSYWVRNMLAVTAACLMVGHAKFDSVGGFDERFMVCGGDVDLCIRLHDAGLWNVMTPFARLVHHEAATRERRPPQNDVDQSLCAYARFLAEGDPFYNSNLTLRDTSCRLASGVQAS